ncbi:hypothetical protein [Adhaeribacter rhizoryzae]|nr:hypothetical protein [Adhaeribacter rhizoryzae]
MNTLALSVMLFTMISVTVVTIYFFIKVLNTPPRPEPDSFSENDDVPRE